MNKYRKISIIVIAVVLVFSMVAPLSMAGTESTSTGRFNLGNSAPIVSTVEIYSNSGLTSVAPALTPQVQYWVKVTIADGNTISDVVGLKLQLFYNAPMDGMSAPDAPGDSETSIIITWTKAGGATATIDPVSGVSNTWIIGTPIIPTVLTAPSGDWVFPITVGKVATQTTPVPAIGQWDFYAKATDAAATTGELYHRGKAMYWYGEVNVVSPTIDFGNVVAGSDFAANVITGTHIFMISNGPFQTKVKSDASWTGAGGALVAALDSTGSTASPNQFAIKTQEEANYSIAIMVSTTPAVVCNEGITGEGGHHDSDFGWWLRISTLFTKDTYSGVVTFSINN